jgi:hypothetical protein
VKFFQAFSNIKQYFSGRWGLSDHLEGQKHLERWRIYGFDRRCLYENVEEDLMEDVDGSGFSIIISGMMISSDDAYTFNIALKSGKSITL